MAKKAETPTTANFLFRMVRQLLDHAAEIELRVDNPARGIKGYSVIIGIFRLDQKANALFWSLEPPCAGEHGQKSFCFSPSPNHFFEVGRLAAVWPRFRGNPNRTDEGFAGLSSPLVRFASGFTRSGSTAYMASSTITHRLNRKRWRFRRFFEAGNPAH